MNGTLTILTLIPFGCVAVIAMAEGNSYLQYGALGLCTIIVIFLCGHIRQLTKNLQEKDSKIIDLTERSITAYHRLSNLIEEKLSRL